MSEEFFAPIEFYNSIPLSPISLNIVGDSSSSTSTSSSFLPDSLFPTLYQTIPTSPIAQPFYLFPFNPDPSNLIPYYHPCYHSSIDNNVISDRNQALRESQSINNQNQALGDDDDDKDKDDKREKSSKAKGKRRGKLVFYYSSFPKEDNNENEFRPASRYSRSTILDTSEQQDIIEIEHSSNSKNTEMISNLIRQQIELTESSSSSLPPSNCSSSLSSCLNKPLQHFSRKEHERKCRRKYNHQEKNLQETEKLKAQRLKLHLYLQQQKESNQQTEPSISMLQQEQEEQQNDASSQQCTRYDSLTIDPTILPKSLQNENQNQQSQTKSIESAMSNITITTTTTTTPSVSNPKKKPIARICLSSMPLSRLTNFARNGSDFSNFSVLVSNHSQKRRKFKVKSSNSIDDQNDQIQIRMRRAFSCQTL